MPPEPGPAARPAPAISVIVPSCNRADLLPVTLDAILAQSLPPAEIIVVDDGSTDRTPAVLERYAPAVRVLRIERSGELVARNAGLHLASGALVAFCGSDDLWRPGYLAAMAALWEAEPCLRLAYADAVALRRGIWLEARSFAGAPAGFWSGLRRIGPGMAVFDAPIVERLLQFQPFQPSAMVADRRFLMETGGWDASLGQGAGLDFATLLRLAEYAPTGVLQQPLVGIRKQASGYSAHIQAVALREAELLDQLLRRRASLRPHAVAIRASVAQRRAQALEIAFVRRDWRAVRQIGALLPAAGIALRFRARARIAGWAWPFRNLAASALLGCGAALSALRRRQD
jgi:glycosyltransferase involved in cell wall biosynthesis